MWLIECKIFGFMLEKETVSFWSLYMKQYLNFHGNFEVYSKMFTGMLSVLQFVFVENMNNMILVILSSSKLI